LLSNLLSALFTLRACEHFIPLLSLQSEHLYRPCLLMLMMTGTFGKRPLALRTAKTLPAKRSGTCGCFAGSESKHVEWQSSSHCSGFPLLPAEFSRSQKLAASSVPTLARECVAM
jgi:hypothetical protein